MVELDSADRRVRSDVVKKCQMAQAAADPGRKGTAHRGSLSACILSTLAAVAWCSACSTTPTTPESLAGPGGVTRQNVAQMVRLAGTVEAVRAFSVNAPRLTGRSFNTPLVITRLVAGGTRVKAGDVLVEFDPQEQQRAAPRRRSAYSRSGGTGRGATRTTPSVTQTS